LPSQHRELWSHFCWGKSIWTIAMSKFSISSAYLPPSVCKNHRPISFVSKVKEMDRWMNLMRTSWNWSSWSFSWIQTTQLKASITPKILLSSRTDGQRSGSSGWYPSVRLRTWCPWRNLLTRAACLSYFEHHLEKIF
jgi:hypothetical protein